MIRRIVVLLVLVSAISLAVFLNPSGTPEGYQGWVEADLLFVGPDEPGRLETLSVSEGETVTDTAPLFAMESDLQRAEVQALEASVMQAQAALDRAGNAQKRPEEIAVLKAQEERVLAAIDASRREFERVKSLVEKGISTNARLEASRAAFEGDTATLNEIRRQIDVAGLAARNEDIEASRQSLAAAQARLAAARTRLAQRKVAAPGEGVIQEIYFRPGEIVGAGRPVVSLLPPGQMKIRFFVPEPELPNVKIGATVLATCDGCTAPRAARITFIAREAEFTPPVIYSLEERAKLVFRVEALPQEPDMLRIGQPVTVTLADGTQ